VWDLRCGVAPDAKIALALEPPPVLTSPAKKSVVTATTEFSWTSATPGVYALDLEPRAPNHDVPSVRVITTETKTLWPEVPALDVSFPRSIADYTCKIARHGPWRSVDELAGPEGVGARAPKARSFSQSREIVLRVPGPPATSDDAGTCTFPYGTAIVCSEKPRELYMLAPINYKLQLHPAFAAAAGVSCVRDCAAARAFMAAYKKYSEEHPGFDANDPMPPFP
jgi:hypothetical protein